MDVPPYSNMAVARAERSVSETLAIEDPVSRIAQLIDASQTVDEHFRLLTFLDAPERGVSRSPFDLGVRATLHLLFEAGLDPDELPTEALAEKARRISLNSSAMLEASVIADGDDIRELYFEEDGGTAVRFNG